MIVVIDLPPETFLFLNKSLLDPEQKQAVRRRGRKRPEAPDPPCRRLSEAS